MIKTIIIVAFVAIIVSLGSALYHLVRHKEHSEQTVKALTYRIGISLALFLFVFLAFVSGLLQPHGISAGMQARLATQHSQPNTAKP